MPRSRLPLLVLLACAALCGAWLLNLDPKARFTTDVTELLPADERDPEARLALSLVRERQSRVVLAVLEAPADTAPAKLAAAAETYVETLLASNAFADAHPLADHSWQHALGRTIHARRLDLLLPGWLAAQRRAYAAEFPSAPPGDPAFAPWLARRTVAALDARLASPEGSALAELAPSDPLLLLPDLADRAAGLAAAPATAPGRALVWAETRAGPLSEEGQQPVFAALAAADSAARAYVPALHSRYTGVSRFAAAAKASTREDISRLNLIAVIAVLAVSVVFVRRVLGLLHLLPVLLFSTLGAIAATTLIFPRVHVLVFVIGSLLSGVAVDYAFHLVLAHREGESYRARVRRLLLPLLGGAGTTFAGFLALVFSELPLVRQLGVYVACGIVAGLGATLLYFAAFPGLDLRPRVWKNQASAPRRLRLPLLLALAAFSIFGLSRIRWNDDLRSLEYPSPAIRADDAAIRAVFGEHDEGASLLTRGASFAEARERWQQLADSAPAGTALSSIATLFPLPADHAAAQTAATRASLAEFATALPAAGAEAGYEPDAFKPFLADLRRHLEAPATDYETLARDTLDALPGPLGLLAHGDAEGAWFLSHGARPIPLENAPGTLSLSGIEGLNHLFARYRVAAGKLSFAGIATLVVIACFFHGLRDGLRTAALPLLATALAFAILALRGEPFGLFHVLGALLGVCLADDYAHFAHADDGTPNARASIRLSALTTSASFAALSLSAIPAVASLGAAVALIVLFALVFVETDLFSLRRHA